jgi:hypothetical protein
MRRRGEGCLSRLLIEDSSRPGVAVRRVGPPLADTGEPTVKGKTTEDGERQRVHVAS